ncbi:Alpha/beta hydrolase family protein [Nannocystis exedens]|nr:alpha/beta hydrolase [Nannocystis exedens]PCC73711.1 Alpha/beta hydrolase family protein [Nannocystis exedens]
MPAEDPAEPAGYAPGPPAKATNTEAAARSDFITPDAIEPGVADAFVAAALAADPVKADWRDLHVWADFTELRTPVLAIHGDRDPVVNQSCLHERLAQIPGGARIEVLAGYDHAAHLERAAPRFVAAVVGFLREHGTPRG